MSCNIVNTLRYVNKRVRGKQKSPKLDRGFKEIPKKK